MIYPTRAAIFVTAAGAPFALLVGVFAPASWYAGLAWPGAVLLLAAIDAVTGARSAQGAAKVSLPASTSVGATVAAPLSVEFAGPAPRTAHIAIAHHALLAPANDGRAAVTIAEGAAA